MATHRFRTHVLLFAACAIAACSPETETHSSSQSKPMASDQLADVSSPPATLIDDSALGDDESGRNWLAFGRTYSEQRFSPLEQINRETVGGLAVDWYLDVPGARGLVSTPLVADGVIYFVESMNRVHAVDLRTREELWMYDPRVAKETGTDLRVGWEHNRGIGLWKDKVYLATWDGRLIAVNRGTGKEAWSVRTFDAAELWFRRVKAPTNDELTHLTHTIARPTGQQVRSDHPGRLAAAQGHVT